MSQDEMWESCEIFNNLFEKLEAKFTDFIPDFDTHFNLKSPGPEAIVTLQERTYVKPVKVEKGVIETTTPLIDETVTHNKIPEFL